MKSLTSSLQEYVLPQRTDWKRTFLESSQEHLQHQRLVLMMRISCHLPQFVDGVNYPNQLFVVVQQ